MKFVKENLLLHPVRMRIVMATAGRQVTAQQLANELPDIPQATLYRHINLLARSGFLKVVREQRIHNTIEKTYALPDEGIMVTPEDLKQATLEDHIHMLTQYFGQLLGYYIRYIQKGEADLSQDPVLFQMIPLNISREEGRQLGQALREVLLPYSKNEPSPERQHVILGLMSVPDVGAGENRMERK